MQHVCVINALSMDNPSALGVVAGGSQLPLANRLGIQGKRGVAEGAGLENFQHKGPCAIIHVTFSILTGQIL